STSAVDCEKSERASSTSRAAVVSSMGSCLCSKPATGGSTPKIFFRLVIIVQLHGRAAGEPTTRPRPPVTRSVVRERSDRPRRALVSAAEDRGRTPSVGRLGGPRVHRDRLG